MALTIEENTTRQILRGIALDGYVRILTSDPTNPCLLPMHVLMWTEALQSLSAFSQPVSLLILARSYELMLTLSHLANYPSW